MARTDEIDDVVSSVRDFVAYRDRHKTQSRILAEKLVLTEAQRVADDAASAAEETALAEDVVADNVHTLDAPKPDDREGLEATIAELEAAVTAQSDNWEPDEGESFAEEAWAVSAFEKPSEEAVAGEVSNTGDMAVDAEPDVDLEAAIAADIASELDAEALRALVVETVHQELSGELGERITRNVRKLVRREINRVLTSRDLGQD